MLNYTVPSNFHGVYNLKISCRDTNLKEMTSKNTTLFIDSNNTVLTMSDFVDEENSEETILPNIYDIRNDGINVNYEAQGDSGNCWAFAVLNSLEYSISKQENNILKFSENNMKNILTTNSIFKSNNTANTGNDFISSVGYLISRTGPIYENKDSYNMYNQLSTIESSDYSVNNVLFIRNRQNTSDNNLIKNAVYKYGAVATTLRIPKDTPEIDNIYENTLNIPNHAVVIIGWDDNYSRYNFEKTAPHDGAFLVKDSVKNSAYYVSYDDFNFGGLYTTKNNNTTSKGLYINNIAFPINSNNNYDNIYQYGILDYDGYATLDTQDLWINNTYIMTNNQYITAIGTYILNKSDYTLKIYRNNHLEYTQHGIINMTGYNTIALKNIISAEKNDQINAVIKITSLEENTTGYMMEKAFKTYNTSKYSSYISSDGVNWINLYDYPQFSDNFIHTASLKLYANDSIINNYNINITPTIHNYTSDNTYTLKIKNNNNPLASTELNINVDDTLYQLTSDNDGIVTVNAQSLDVGEHTIEISNNNLGINFNTSITVLNNTLDEDDDIIFVDMVNDKFIRGINNKIKVYVYHDDGVRVNTGKVVIKINGKTLEDDDGHVIYAKVVKGEVIFNYTINSSYALKEYPVSVVYLSTMGRFESNYNISIVRNDINMCINELNAFYGENLYINASVKLIDGENIDGEMLSFKVNGISLNTAYVNNGIVILNQTLPSAWNPGEYNLEVVMGQTSWHNSIRYKTIFNIYNKTDNFDNNLTYSLYYPVYGEYEYVNDEVVDIDITDIYLSVSIKYLVLSLSAQEGYTVYYTTDGQQPTTSSNTFTDSQDVNLRLLPTSEKTKNNDYTSTQFVKSVILKYCYMHNGVMSDTYYYQANGVETPHDDIYPSYLAYIYMDSGIDNRNPEIYTQLNKNTDSTYNLTITANKTGTIQYKINNNTPQTYNSHSILTVNENSNIEITLTTSDGQIVTKNMTVVDCNKPLVVVKAITTYADGSQQVIFNCDDENVTIYYTRDGSDPLNTNNLQQATTSTILTLNNLTQLRYYAKNSQNITSPVYLYRTPRNEVSPVNLSIRKELNQYNTYKAMIQTNNNYSIYYTVDGTVATVNSYKYDDNKIILHNHTVLNLLLIDQNNYRHYYNYTILNELTEYVPINYTVKLANYHNITLPEVNKYNNIYDQYIIKEGVNGTVILPFIRTVNIIVNNQAYNFVNGQIDGIYNIQENDYFLGFDGQITTINHVNPPKNEGIIIYIENNTTIIEYHDKTTESINQFSVEYTTRYNHNTNNILLVDCIDFNLNNKYTASIETNTLPLETITNTCSDMAIRYQLARQNQYTGNIISSTYTQITNNNIPIIKYTVNNKNIYINDEEPVFDNFIYNPNIIKTSVTINGKNTNRTFSLSHKDYEDILQQQLAHEQTLEQLENMTYKYTGTIESYAIVNQKIDYNTWINYYDDYINYNGNLLSYTTFLISLKTIECHDNYSSSKQNDYTILWNRTSNIAMECFINASKIIINSFNPDMGVTLSGQEMNKIYFRLETSSKLSIIESEMINIIRNRSGIRRINSTIQTVTDKMQRNNVSYITLNNLIIIYDDKNQIALCINLETGLITDYLFDEFNEYGHEAYEECPNCMFMTDTNVMQGRLNVNVNNYNFSNDNIIEIFFTTIRDLSAITYVYEVFSEFSKILPSKLLGCEFIIETAYDLHYQSLVKQINGEESWTYKDAGYYNIYDKFEDVGYSMLRHMVPRSEDWAYQLFEKGYIEDWKIMFPQIYQAYKIYGYFKTNYHDIYFKMEPVTPSLMDGYYTYNLPPTEDEIKNNRYSYVAIRFNKNIFHISEFGNYDRNSAFIVNQTSGNVTKLSPEESYNYFKGNSVFHPISNLMMEENNNG